MIHSIRLSLATVAACGLLFSAAPAFAAPKDYQVTGNVTALTDSTITLEKGKTLWEVGRDANTKAASGLKVGDHITVHYTITATTIDLGGSRDKSKKPPSDHAGRHSRNNPIPVTPAASATPAATPQ